jgi:hypothetical protein
MAEYLLRKANLFYELAKFEDSDTPTAIYKFTKRGCTCPAGRRGCKHVKIMKAWKDLDEPFGYVFDDNAKHIGTLFVS